MLLNLIEMTKNNAQIIIFIKTFKKKTTTSKKFGQSHFS